jgi:anti-sigma regulatory factor (Ser/Thr protein kinase)
VTDPRPPADLWFPFDAHGSAPTAARAAIRSFIADPHDPVLDDVLLAASELISNVILHTSRGGELGIWDPKPAVPLRIEVHDRDPTLPHIVERPAVGGHGLGIVASVAADWGVTPTPRGKFVWAEFHRPGGPQ